MPRPATTTRFASRGSTGSRGPWSERPRGPQLLAVGDGGRDRRRLAGRYRGGRGGRGGRYRAARTSTPRASPRVAPAPPPPIPLLVPPRRHDYHRGEIG